MPVSSVHSQRLPLPDRKTVLVVGLAALVFLVFGQTATFDFVAYDDNRYIQANSIVRRGLAPDTVRWAFTTFAVGNWHPVTWLSYLLDATLFDLNPGPMHLVNAAFHAVNAVLVFVFLNRTTGQVGRAAAVAALFAVHPLHVESVAWIAERKDVVSLFFGLLALTAYHAHTQVPSPRRYAVALSLFALAVMAKPMLVTLPCVMLLLDYWPLKRQSPTSDDPAARRRILMRLVLEKVPFLLLSAVSSLLTFEAQRASGAVQSFVRIPISLRLENTATAYFEYLQRTAWPRGLAVFHPYDFHPPVWKAGLALVVLIAVTTGAVRFSVSRPYLLVGWLWFLGTLVPVIGLVQVGAQAMADRYTYFPHIGLFTAVVWGIGDLLADRPGMKTALPAVAAAVVVALAGCAWIQTGYWRDSLTLFSRAVAVTSDNAVMHSHLGGELIRRKRFAEALPHFREAARIEPGAAASYNLGFALQCVGNLPEAIDNYRRAVERQPTHYPAHHQLGALLVDAGQIDEGITHLLEAVRINPELVQARLKLVEAYARQGRFDEARRQEDEAARGTKSSGNAQPASER